MVWENCVAILQFLLWFLIACNNIQVCFPESQGTYSCGICTIYYDECFCISHNFGQRVKVEVLHNMFGNSEFAFYCHCLVKFSLVLYNKFLMLGRFLADYIYISFAARLPNLNT